MSRDVRSQLWYTLLDAERESRYYAKLASRNRWRHTFFSITTMVLSLLAGVTLFMPIASELRPSWTASLFLAVSSLTAVMIVWDFSGHAKAAQIASELIRGLCTEARQAWYRGPEVISQEDVSDLERRLDAITRVDSTLDDKLTSQCAADAYNVIQNELARRGETAPDARAGSQART